MTARIAVLGLGAMGSRIALRLVGAGHALVVWNRSPAPAAALAERGAAVADTPRAAVRDADLVIAMVRDDEASRAVWDDPRAGALAGLMPGSLAVECSTLGLDRVRDLGARALAAGAAFVDAPVVGSRLQAEAGALVVLAGGPEAAVARLAPLIAPAAGTVHRIGDVGAGTAAKLAVNALFATQVCGLAEALGLIGRAGLDPAGTLEILATLPVLSAAATAAGRGMVAGRFAPQFPVELAAKDLALALELGDAPLARAAAGVMAAAVERGWAGDNLTAVARLYAAPA